MSKTLLRVLLGLLGGLIAARLVEAFLTSERGQRLAEQAGLGDLTTHRGVELAQKYARAVAGVIGAAVVGIQESLESAARTQRQATWPDRVQVYAQYFLAVGSLAKTVSDFLEERRQMLGEGLSRS